MLSRGPITLGCGVALLVTAGLVAIPCAVRAEAAKTSGVGGPVVSDSGTRAYSDPDQALSEAMRTLAVSGQDLGESALASVAKQYRGTHASFRAYSMLASLRSRRGDRAGEMAIWNEAVSVDGESQWGEAVARGLGGAYLAAKDYDRGAAELRAVLARVRRHEFKAGAALMLGMILEAKGDLPGAMAAYRKACAASPDSEAASDAVELIRVLLSKHRSLDRALSALEELNRAYVSRRVGTAAECALGQVYLDLKRFSLAEQAFRSVVDSAPGSPLAERARTSFLSMYWDESIFSAERVDAATAIAFFEKVLRYETRGYLVGEANYSICAWLLSKAAYSDLHERVRKALQNPLAPEFGVWADEMRELDALAYYNAGDSLHALPALRALLSGNSNAESRTRYSEMIATMERQAGVVNGAAR